MTDKQYQEELLNVFKKGVDETIQISNGNPNLIGKGLENYLIVLEKEFKSSQESAKKYGEDYDYSKTISEAENYIKEKLKLEKINIKEEIKCKHNIVTYIGEQETLKPNKFLKLYNCLICDSTIILEKDKTYKII